MAHRPCSRALPRSPRSLILAPRLVFTLALAAPLAGVLPGLHAVARADDARPEAPPEDDDADAIPYGDVNAFDRDFAVAVYGTGQAGSYRAAGLGGRLRWQPFDDRLPLGLEAYVEATVVDWDGDAFRHDYPNGFNVFVPFRLGPSFRLRGFFGFCDIVSFVEPAQEGAPRADDVLFGLHGGVGAELAIHPMFSLFADLQVNGYTGHDRSAKDWTGGVDEDFSLFWNTQLNLGVQFHVGR